MTVRRVVALVAAAAAIALLWAPYFAAVGHPIRLTDSGATFTSAWLARAGVALLVVSAALLFVNAANWSSGSALASAVVTLGAGTVPGWRGSTCGGWAFYSVPADPCSAAQVENTLRWGWVAALLLAVAVASAPLWTFSLRAPYGPASMLAVAALSTFAVVIASFGPVMHLPQGMPRRYADYLRAAGSTPAASGWHGWVLPTALVLLLLAALAVAAHLSVATALAALSTSAAAIDGGYRGTYGSAGWGYWLTLGCAVAVLAVTLAATRPFPRRWWRW